MNPEIAALIESLEETLTGEPWYGKSFQALAGRVQNHKVYQKPGEHAHSLADLLYHMITWAEFTLLRLQKKEQDMEELEAMDWRQIDPATHTWENGSREFVDLIHAIINELNLFDPERLNEKVDYRQYDFRTLLNGLVQHTIYHLGQVAYADKLLSS